MGSAKRTLDARIARHVRRRRVPHWHIDDLLASANLRVVEVFHSPFGECALNRLTRGRIVVPGFAASDCRAGCGAHLKYLD
jgi:Uri superfamily endonuclease